MFIKNPASDNSKIANEPLASNLKLNNLKEIFYIFIIIYLFANFLKRLFLFAVGIDSDGGSILISLFIFITILFLAFIGLIIYYIYSLRNSKIIKIFPTRRYLIKIFLILSVVVLFFQFNGAKMLVKIIPNEKICKANLINTFFVHNDSISQAVYYRPYSKCIVEAAKKQKDFQICNQIQSEKDQENCLISLAIYLRDYQICNNLPNFILDTSYNISLKNNCIDKIAEETLDYKNCQTTFCVEKIARELKNKEICNYIIKLKI